MFLLIIFALLSLSPQWQGSRKIKVTISGVISEPQCPNLYNGNNSIYLRVIARTTWLIRGAQEMVTIDYYTYSLTWRENRLSFSRRRNGGKILLVHLYASTALKNLKASMWCQFHRWENWALERISGFYPRSQSRVRGRDQLCLIPKPHSFTTILPLVGAQVVGDMPHLNRVLHS